ncbi:hypothetical protein OEB96_33820 [Paraliomyxa miuraensis]|nr:hypothetical protein [Paraliomyxa miuraensis]
MRELQAKNLVKLRKQEFEEFCRKLLDEEVRRCFEPRTVRVIGPAPEDYADGGRDLQTIVRKAPGVRSQHGLLPFDPGSLWFSCKTLKDEKGRRWKDQVRDDIDPSPRIFNATTGKVTADPAKRTKEKPKPPLRLLELLADGGEYRVLLNVEGDHIPEFEAELATRLQLWIEHGLGRRVDLTGRVQVHDATDIANAFNERKFTLTGELSRLLEVDEPQFLESWEQWSAELPEDRRKVPFVEDGERTRLVEALGSMLGDGTHGGPERRVFRLAGAPGVGKTRAVHHVFEHPKHEVLHARIRYTREAERAREWLESEKLESSPDIVLVVDEVEPYLAHDLWRSFGRARAEQRARLILIGPQDDGHVGKPEPFFLERFQSRSDQRTLVANDLQAAKAEGRDVGVLDDALVDVIADLAEGYPLFSMWLTLALAEEPTLLDDPGCDLTDGDDPWYATAAVLVGAPSAHAGREAWKAEAELRARALLLVVLVPDDPLSMPTDQQSLLVKALGVHSWEELHRAAFACKYRRLLREEPASHHYISPANLERLVLNHLLGRPEGPDPGVLRDAVPEGFERLLRRAARVRASEACRRRLARAALAPFEDAEGELEPRLLRRLGLIAEVHPEQTAFGLVRLLDRVGAPRIAEDDGLVGPIREALEHVRHRRIAGQAFEAAERALFMLALERQERWGTNARAVWASLFQAVLDQTHQPFEARLTILKHRLSSSEPTQRHVALEGVAQLIVGESGGFHPGIDDVDGEWVRPTELEILERRRTGWRLLLDMSDDPDAEVGGRARTLVAEHLWTGLSRSSLRDVLDELPERVGRWTPVERNALREAVEDALGRHMHEDEERRAVMCERLADLREALRPTDLQERLLSQVGRGSPAKLSIATAARLAQEREDDRILAREILERPDVLTATLAWLTSEQAGRARAFAHALGHEDDAQALLPLLLSARGHHPVDPLIVSYLSGRSDGAGSMVVDSWLLAHASDPSLTNIVARTIVAVGGTDDRARILTMLLHRPELTERSVLGLGFWSWHEGVSVEALDALIAALDRAPHRFCHHQGLGLVARRLARAPGAVDPSIVALAHSLLRSTSAEEQSAVLERDWIAVATGLHARGDANAIATVLRIIVAQGGYLRHAREVLRHWLDEDPTGLWRVIVGEFLEHPSRPSSVLRRFASDVNVIGGGPAEEILAWVGLDRSRGQCVAEWSSPRFDELDPVVRGLLIRFGADGEVARALFGAAMQPPTGLTVSRFEAEQLERAAHWADDPQPAVSVWVGRLRDVLIERGEVRRRRGYG